jgi:hypothetical protein
MWWPWWCHAARSFRAIMDESCVTVLVLPSEHLGAYRQFAGEPDDEPHVVHRELQRANVVAFVDGDSAAIERVQQALDRLDS